MTHANSLLTTLRCSLLLGTAILARGSTTVHAQSDADLQAIEKDLNDVGTRITRLQDLTDVEIVQDAYGYYVDKAQWRSLAGLFAEDATLEIGGKGVFTGKARVFEYMQTGLGPIGPRKGGYWEVLK